MRLLVLVLSSLALTASVAPPKLPEEVRDYPSWTLVTPNPVPVPLSLWLLCRHPNREELAEAERAHGDHAHHVVSIFVNGLAAAHFADASAAMPPGSIVVKEKLDGDEVAAVAAMIKREAGFSPETGDWEFLYASKTSERGESKPLQAHCGGCHGAVKSTDWLFRSYLSDAAAPEAGR